MSGSFESMRWNACVHRLDLGLYSHPKEFWGNRVRNHVNSKEKIPSTGGSEDVRTCIAASCRMSPTHYRLSYSGPQTDVMNVVRCTATTAAMVTKDLYRIAKENLTGCFLIY